MSRGLPFPQHPSPSSCWEGEVDQQLTMVLELGPGGHHTHRGPRLPQNRVMGVGLSWSVCVLSGQIREVWGLSPSAYSGQMLSAPPTSSLSSTPEAPASQPHFLLLQRFWPEWHPGSFGRKHFCVTPPLHDRGGGRLPTKAGHHPSTTLPVPCRPHKTKRVTPDQGERQAGLPATAVGGPGPTHTAPPSQDPHTSLTALHPLKLELPPGLTQHCCQPSRNPLILHPSFHLSTHPPTHPFTCISIFHLLIHPSIHSPTALSIHPSIPIH